MIFSPQEIPVHVESVSIFRDGYSEKLFRERCVGQTHPEAGCVACGPPSRDTYLFGLAGFFIKISGVLTPFLATAVVNFMCQLDWIVDSSDTQLKLSSGGV